MRQVEALISPYLVDDVKERLSLVGVRGMTVHPITAVAFARPLIAERSEVSFMRLFIVAPEELVETIINAILTVCRRSPNLDGLIFIGPVEDAIRIRTGQTGRDAL